MITQSTNLNLIPGKVLPRINASQYDKSSRTLNFTLWDGEQSFLLTSGMTARLQGIKPDRHGFDYSATIDTTNQLVIADVTQQMTAVPGDVVCEVVLFQDSQRLGSCNFVLSVEVAPLNDDTIVSDSELPDIIAQATAQMEAAAASALEAEGFAKGTQDGTPVSSGPYYEANAKYYKEQAANSATTASNKAGEASSSASSANTDALKAEGYAVGQQDGTDVGSGSEYYHNNAKYYSGEASASADRAEAYSVNVPYIGANGNWWVWNTTAGAYVDSGVDASITVDIADITMLEPNETPYVTNTGTDTDPIFHLFIPRGKGIASITKTSTSGLVDTYTITYSDGYTTTFTVTNGKTAYQSAVEGGYSGTEQEFEDDLGNFENYKTAAVNAASDANTSAINANQSYLDAKAQADRAQLYADFIEPHFIIQNNRLYIKDDAVGEFIVANNRLYMKLIA